MNGPSKTACLAKFKPNFKGFIVSNFSLTPSRSLDFFCKPKKVSGSQKRYQSRRLAKSRIYHSTAHSRLSARQLFRMQIHV